MSTFHLLRLMGLRHMQRQLFRTLISITGVAVGVAMLTAVQSLNRGISDAFEGMLKKVSNGVDLVVGGVGDGVAEDLLPRIVDVKGVTHAAGVVEQVVSVPAFQERMLLLGVDLLGDQHFVKLDGASKEDETILEEPFSFLNSAENVLITQRFADAHQLKRGDTLVVQSPAGKRKLLIYGLIKAQGAGDAWGGAVAVMNADAAQLVLGRPGRFTRVDVAVSSDSDVDATRRLLEAQLGAGAEVRLPQQLGVLGKGVTGVFQNGLNMSSFVSLLVALGIIANTVLISVLQRRRELGILRATGATRGQVLLLVLVEAGMLGIVGGVSGAVAGWAMARGALGAAAEVFSSAYLPIHPDAAPLTWADLVLGMGLGLTASLLAAVFPARTAAHVSPITIMGRSSVAGMMDPPRTLPRLLLALLLGGGAMAITAVPLSDTQIIPAAGIASVLVFGMLLTLTPLGMVLLRRLVMGMGGSSVPLSVRLAMDNMVRTLKSGASNVTALGMAVLVVISMGSYVDSFAGSLSRWASQSVVGDLVVTGGDDPAGLNSTPMDDGVVAHIKALPGVQEVLTTRLINQPLGDAVVKLRAQPMEGLLARSQPQVIAGGPLRASDFSDPSHPGACISETLAEKNGFHVGDTLSLNTPAGKKDFTIRAVLVDYASPVGVITVDSGVFRTLWTDRLHDLLQVFVVPGVDVLTVRQRIVAELGEEHALSVISNERFREQMDETINRFFWLTRILIIMAMLVAVLGIINSLQASVMDRTREIGMLRAVGAFRHQVAGFIVLEALAMALVALVLGSLAGMFTGASMIETLMRNQTGWKLHFGVPWVTLGFNTVLTLCMAALSAWLPARKAAQMRVTDALQFD